MLENMIIKPVAVIQPFSPDGSVAWQAQELLQFFTYLWWECDSSQPDLPCGGTPQEKKDREHELEQLTDGLIHRLKRAPSASSGQEALRQELMAAGGDFARRQLGFTEAQIDLIRKHHFFEIAAEFARQARQFDPAISDADIFQASRNVMTMNFIQMLLNLPVSLTPSIFAYSMLYPYTDNYLDDPAIDHEIKLSFNQRFRRRLLGETVHPANAHEKAINDLVAIIEGEFDRSLYPQVYESLLVIHTAQVRSLRLLHQIASPYNMDVLGITFAKGGTSVLADGYLVADRLTPPQAEFLFGYGAFTQLMDDLEDIQSDYHDGQMTIFSQNAGRWPLDELTNHTIHFGHKIFASMDGFPSPDSQVFREFLTRCIDPLLIDSAGQVSPYYTPAYLAQLEDHFPFHFTFLRRLRQKITRQKVSLVNVIRLFS